MSIGQHISQKRKELGLSQEALGDRLGVSRQAIYKWESDAALPEIEKLIALSRLFQVSVGWLLGVEEDASPEAAPAQEGELTETQLKMVEEIVSRYLAAQPKPPSPRRRWLFRGCAAAAAICLAAVLYQFSGKLDRLDNRYSNLESSVSSVTRSVNSQIDGISNRVESILKAQNDLTADYGVEIVDANLQRGVVVFSVYAVPKTYQEGMTAVFQAENIAGGVQSVPGEMPMDQRFTATMTCRLTDSITFSVVFQAPDGTRQTQLLQTFSGLYSQTLPAVELMGGEHLLRLEPDSDGAIHIPALSLQIGVPSSAAAVDEALGTAEIKTVRVGLFLNQKLVAWANPEDGASDSFLFPETAVQMTGDDSLCFAAVVTDEYGRDTVFSDVPCVLSDSGLTWPDAADLSDHDPSNWAY